MNEKFWAKLSYLIGFLPVAGIFALIVQVANLEIKDLDLWLHIGVGKIISVEHYIPKIDIFSCTMAGKAWVNHEWLFQVIVYNIFNTFGPGGLQKMQIFLVFVTMLLLFFLGNSREKQLMTSFVLLLVYLVYQQRFTLRPDIFSLFFFALYIFILALYIDRKWSLSVLAVVQILWTNIHGFFFFGPLFVLIGIAAQWCRCHLPLPYDWNESGRLTDDEYRRLKQIFLVVVICCLFNPHFIKGAMYPFDILTGISGEDKIFFKYIQELERPLQWSKTVAGHKFVYYKLIMLVSFLSFVFNRRRIDISALFFWLVFLFFSMNAMRNTSFFAFAAYLAYITNAVHLSYKDVVPIRFTDEKFRHLTSIFVKILIFVWIFKYSQIIGSRGYFDFDNYKMKSEFGGVSLKSYPHRAVDFLIENEIKGNFFNGFNSGSYLIGRCYPDIKVFIDGRTELYGGKFFLEFQNVWGFGDLALLEEFIEKYKITGVFLNSVRFQAPDQVVKYLYEHEDWIPVYFDYDAVIFLKDVEQNKPVIEKHRLNLKDWRSEKVDLSKYRSYIITPFHHYFRAYTLHSMGLNEAALIEAQEAIRIAPDYAEPYHLIGKIYGQNDEFLKASEYLRSAVVLKPDDEKMRLNLVRSYIDRGLLEVALEECEEILRNRPHEVKALYYKALVYAKDKKYDQAVAILEKDIQPYALNINDVIYLGDVFYEQKAYQEALNLYKKAFSYGADSDNKSAQKIVETYQSLGDVPQALEFLKKTIPLLKDPAPLKQLFNEISQQLGGENL